MQQVPTLYVQMSVRVHEQNICIYFGIEIKNIIYHNDRTSEKILAKIILHRLKEVYMDKTYEYFSMHHSLMLQERNRDREFS